MRDGTHDFDGIHTSEYAFPVQDLRQDLRQALTALISQETDRARVALTDERKGGEIGTRLGVTGWAIVFMVAAASFSIILALGQTMDLWAGALIVAGGFAVVALVSALTPRVLTSDTVRRNPRLAWVVRLTAFGSNGRPAVTINGARSDGTVTVTGRAATPVREEGTARATLALVGDNISVAFGGVRAVDNVSVRVAPGQRVGIVGANGAGKTTLFNALTGFVPTAGGTVHLGDADISKWAAFARARHGVRRTFQQPRVADTMTVEQNIFCGHGDHDSPEQRQRADWLLEHFGLASLRALPLGALPFGQRREVELIRALMRTPQVLMLDEPVSGLEDEEVEKLVATLLQLQASEGWGLVVIEHDLKFITEVAEHLLVMEDGHLLTEGPLHAVMREPEVRRVYLGELVDV